MRVNHRGTEALRREKQGMQGKTAEYNGKLARISGQNSGVFYLKNEN